MPLIITGDEAVMNCREPEGALAEFYRAFNSRDLALLEQNWAGDEASMFHPLGGMRLGWSDIRDMYEQVFRAPAGVQMSFHDCTITRFGDSFIAVGIERGLVRTVGAVMRLRVRASRMFIWRSARWKQAHFHGSLEEPEQLAQYMTMMLTGETVAPEA